MKRTDVPRMFPPAVPAGHARRAARLVPRRVRIRKCAVHSLSAMLLDRNIKETG